MAAILPHDTMNDRQDSSADEDQEITPAESEQADSAGDSETPGEAPARAPTKGRSAFGIAVFALVLAAAGAGASGWLWWQSRQASQTSPLDEIRAQVEAALDRTSRLEQRIGATSALPGRLDRLEQRLEETEAVSGRFDRLQGNMDQVDELSNRVDSLGTRLEQLAGRLDEAESQAGADETQLQSLSETSESLAERVSSLEQAVAEQLDEFEERLSSNRREQTAALQDQADARRRELILLEVSGLLRLGQARAELSGDFDGARAAYRLASRQLQAIGGGGLERARSLLSEERDALSSLDAPDWPSIGATLRQLEGRAADWPLLGAPVEEAAPAEESESERESDGWWQGMGRAFRGLVRVSERDAAALPASAVESIRERVGLHLSAAQAAAARRSAVELSGQAAAVAEILRSRFDVDAAPVARAIESLEQLSGLQQPSAPDLGRALAELESRLSGS